MRFQAGDVVSVSKGLIQHMGIVVSADPPEVAHNHPDNGVATVVPFDVFAHGQPVQLEYRPGTATERARVVRGAHRHLGRRYNLVVENCETFVQRAKGRKVPVSDTVAALTALAGVGVVGLGLIRGLARRWNWLASL